MNNIARSLMAVVMSIVIAGAFSGCVPLWVGAGVAGIVGGYAVSPDTVEGTTTHTTEECWDAAKQIAGIMGQVVQEGPSGSQLDATINGSKVTIVLSAINVSTTKLSVKARKAFMPKIDVAQDVYAKIINSMEK